MQKRNHQHVIGEQSPGRPKELDRLDQALILRLLHDRKSSAEAIAAAWQVSAETVRRVGAQHTSLAVINACLPGR